ncbi:MAG: hypothetical protein JWO06_3235 [Bacteroidota bacterium]|nr:hypothetical protein [Bacteroidota bacterium]
MKNPIIFFLLVTSVFVMSSCNDNPPPKQDESGVKIEGKKGGEMEINKDKLEIEGKKGGELKMDSNGVKVKNGKDTK